MAWKRAGSTSRHMRHMRAGSSTSRQLAPVALDGLEALRRLDLPVNDERADPPALSANLSLQGAAKVHSIR
jgi:hypothetical protein